MLLDQRLCRASCLFLDVGLLQKLLQENRQDGGAARPCDVAMSGLALEEGVKIIGGGVWVYPLPFSELLEDKKTNNTRWWQVLLLILSPIVSAIVVYALAGGFTK